METQIMIYKKHLLSLCKYFTHLSPCRANWKKKLFAGGGVSSTCTYQLMMQNTQENEETKKLCNLFARKLFFNCTRSLGITSVSNGGLTPNASFICRIRSERKSMKHMVSPSTTINKVRVWLEWWVFKE